MREKRKNPEFRARARQAAINYYWRNRAGILEKHKTPEYRQKLNAISKAYYARNRYKVLEYHKEYSQRPEVKTYRAEYDKQRGKLRWQNPVKRIRMQSRMQNYFQQNKSWLMAKHKEYAKDYRKTATGKTMLAKHKATRRELGFILLNEPQKGFEGHHIDKQHVIFVPKQVHRSVFHKQNDKKSMEAINTVIYTWLLYPGLIFGKPLALL